jgi:hypothetical protein
MWWNWSGCQRIRMEAIGRSQGRLAVPSRVSLGQSGVGPQPEGPGPLIKEHRELRVMPRELTTRSLCMRSIGNAGMPSFSLQAKPTQIQSAVLHHRFLRQASLDDVPA